MPDKTLITVEAAIEAPGATVWECWTKPEHIMQWNSASDDWHTPHATIDLREGGEFKCRMEAKDGSAGFDFKGTYTKIIPQKRLESTIEDGRTISVQFEEQADGSVRVTETFEAEEENSEEMQRQGWQAILDHFKRYVESL